MRSLFFLSFILVLFAACNSKTASVTSGAISQTAPYLWQTGFPKNVVISTAFNNPVETTKINEMAAAWDTSVNNQINFFNFTGTDSERTDTITGPNQLRDNVFGIYKATNHWPYPDYPLALAITQIFAIRYNSGASNEYAAIQEADIILNDEGFDFDAPPGPPFVLDYDFRTVVLHEMGHFLGLQHKSPSNRLSTVMYPSIFSYETKRIPQTIDAQDLAAKYNIVLPLTAGGSSITSGPVSYTRNLSDQGEMVKVILELRANGDCIHRMDGVEYERHHIQGLKK